MPDERGKGVCVRLAGGRPRAQAFDGAHKAFADNRFEQVVNRTFLERVNGVLVVGRNKHDLCLRTRFSHCRRDFQASQARHADVKEGDVGLMLANRFKRRTAVFTSGDHVQVRPFLAQQIDQRLAKNLFVFGDHTGELITHDWPPWGPSWAPSPGR